MAAAAAVYILFLIGGASLPSLQPMGSFNDQAACETAARAVEAALTSADSPAHVMCVSADALSRLKPE